MKNDPATKCRTCAYAHICGGLTDTQRINCTEWTQGNAQEEWEREVSRRWGEMSYYRSGDPANTPSMSERLRRGE